MVGKVNVTFYKPQLYNQQFLGLGFTLEAIRQVPYNDYNEEGKYLIVLQHTQVRTVIYSVFISCLNFSHSFIKCPHFK